MTATHSHHDHSAAHHHGHDHGHDHGPGGHHHHHHLPSPGSRNGAFGFAILLNTGFVTVEFIYGVITQSTALMADAGHNLSDVLGLLLAWGAALLSQRQPAGRYTYGLGSASILAALANALLLTGACGVIAWEAAHRLIHPEPVAGLTVSVVAAIGVVINGVSAWMFVAGSKDDLNVRGAFLHMAADALISLGVAIAGIVMFTTHWYWLDAAISLVIVAVILWGTWGLLRHATQLSMNAVPAHIDLTNIRAFLQQLPGVDEVCDLHVWGISTTRSALTAHLCMPLGAPGDAFIETTAEALKQRFRIDHATLQITQHKTPGNCSLSMP